jgi:glycosyltransferase involved in cell wall biosynthesis
LASKWDVSWHPHGRHVREEELGLTPARLRGLREAGGDLFLFVDDDNVLTPEYLETAIAIAQRNPHLGVFGAGVLEPEFEVKPRPELVPSLGLLALRSVPSAQWSNVLRHTDCFPWGAGLCGSRRVAEIFSQLIERLNASHVIGRRGEELFCGDDDLFSWASVAGGQGFGLFPELRITHLISAQRLTRNYVLRFVRGHEFSHAVLRFLLAGTWPDPLSAGHRIRMLLHGLRRGYFSMRCQWSVVHGRRDALKFIVRNGLKPIVGALADVRQIAPIETVLE